MDTLYFPIIVIKEFNNDFLGVNTNAPSAKKGHFFAETPHTAGQYARLASPVNADDQLIIDKLTQQVIEKFNGIKGLPDDFKIKSLEDLKDYKNASECINTETIILNDLFSTHVQIGELFFSINDYPKAVESFDLALSIKYSTEISNKKAKCLYSLTKYDEALLIYNQSLSIRFNPDIFNEKINCLTNLKRNDELNEYFHKTLNKIVLEFIFNYNFSQLNCFFSTGRDLSIITCRN